MRREAKMSKGPKDPKVPKGAKGRCSLSAGVLCCSVLLAVTARISAAPAAQQGELIDRTLALVAGQAITLSDVRTAMTLRLIEPESPDDLAEAVSRLVDRLLVLREVQRYAPPEPSDAQLDQQLAGLRSRFASAVEFTRVLESGGFSEARLRGWLRDDLRITSYLAQRFAAVGVPTDDEVGAFYAANKDQFDRQALPLAAAAPAIRERLAEDRRAQLIADWVADLRRRTAVVELWKEKR